MRVTKSERRERVKEYRIYLYRYHIAQKLQQILYTVGTQDPKIP